jgi:hypothetical protein
MFCRSRQGASAMRVKYLFARLAALLLCITGLAGPALAGAGGAEVKATLKLVEGQQTILAQQAAALQGQEAALASLTRMAQLQVVLLAAALVLVIWTIVMVRKAAR